jgi:hypothetical protein
MDTHYIRQLVAKHLMAAGEESDDTASDAEGEPGIPKSSSEACWDEKLGELLDKEKARKRLAWQKAKEQALTYDTATEKWLVGVQNAPVSFDFKLPSRAIVGADILQWAEEAKGKRLHAVVAKVLPLVRHIVKDLAYVLGKGAAFSEEELKAEPSKRAFLSAYILLSALFIANKKWKQTGSFDLVKGVEAARMAVTFDQESHTGIMERADLQWGRVRGASNNSNNNKPSFNNRQNSNRFNNNSNSTQNKAKTNTKFAKRGKGGAARVFKCYNCGLPGHKKSECQAPKKGRAPPPQAA